MILKKPLFLSIFLVLVAQLGIAQEKEISGTVTDRDGEPLPGVNITVKGASTGTSTDFDGEYSLEVEKGKILRFSIVGFEDKTKTVGDEGTIDVVMNEGEKLEEVVVDVGYGTSKKSDLTGSVSPVSSENIEKTPTTNPEIALQGQSPGVHVTKNSGRPGGNAQVRVRGHNSINTSNDPLYVVDGVIGVDLSLLNPNDIESMEVLKDASATAIYGARGANGVIIVTTKGAGEEDSGTISYDSYISFGTFVRKHDLLNSEQFLQVEENSYENAKKYDPSGWEEGKYTNPKKYREEGYLDEKLFDDDGNPLYDTDWQKEATRTAITHNHNLSFTKGDEDQSYGLFLNYANEEGIMKESDLKRYSARFIFNNQIKDWLKVGGGMTFNHIKDNRIDQGQGGLTPLRLMTETLPIIPLRFDSGQYGTNAIYPNMEGGENPVNLLRNRKDIHKTQTVLANAFAEIDLTDHLQLRTSLGANIENEQEDVYSGRLLRNLSRDNNGEASVENFRKNYWQFENTLSYEKDFNDNNGIDAMVGIGWQEESNFRTYAGAQGFSSDFFKQYNLAAGSNKDTPETEKRKWTMSSYFGRINYRLLDSKFLFTLTGRLDGSSRFGADNKRAFFPSGAFAWNLSKEDFLKHNSVINNLKLRTSVGQTGNTEIDEYQSLASLKTSNVILGGSRSTGIGIDKLGNPDLKWEKTNQFDIGLELGLFNNRISLETDFYYKETKDMLLDAPIPATTGYTSVFQNIGKMQNKGFDIALSTHNMDTDNFSWDTDLNISVNRNKINALGEANDDIFPGPYFLEETNVLRVGEEVGSYYGLIREGTWGSDEAEEAEKYGKLPGDIKHKDINEDGKIDDDDRVIIGHAYPKFDGSLRNTWSYKNFNLSLDLQFSYGNDVLNLSRHSGEDRTGMTNSYATVLNGWSPDNQDTDIAQNRPADAGYTTTVDSHMVEDGSFLRGRNIQLAYNFSENVTERLRLSKLRVYFSAQNFFLITDYSGYDPEVSTYGEPFSQGVSFYDYPNPRTYTIGLNVEF